MVKPVENGEKKIEADVNKADKTGKLRPAQAKEPPIDIAPLPGRSIYLHEFDLPRSE
jgi:hypothetical protein